MLNQLYESKIKSFFGLREPLSGLSHFLGFLSAIAGLIWLLHQAWLSGSAREIIACTIYGISLVLLYLASTLYHCLILGESSIAWFKRIDHMMIFVLIAGTYTPVCLVTLGGNWGLFVFAIIWFLTLLGITSRIFWFGMPRWAYVGIYLLMGWFVVFLLPSLRHVMTAHAFFWLITGGLIYTLGAIIYALKKPNLIPGIWGFHETWHVFVLGGSACHYFAIVGSL